MSHRSRDPAVDHSGSRGVRRRRSRVRCTGRRRPWGPSPGPKPPVSRRSDQPWRRCSSNMSGRSPPISTGPISSPRWVLEGEDAVDVVGHVKCRYLRGRDVGASPVVVRRGRMTLTRGPKISYPDVGSRGANRRTAAADLGRGHRGDSRGRSPAVPSSTYRARSPLCNPLVRDALDAVPPNGRAHLGTVGAPKFAASARPYSWVSVRLGRSHAVQIGDRGRVPHGDVRPPCPSCASLTTNCEPVHRNTFYEARLWCRGMVGTPRFGSRLSEACDVDVINRPDEGKEGRSV